MKAKVLVKIIREYTHIVNMLINIVNAYILQRFPSFQFFLRNLSFKALQI